MMRRETACAWMFLSLPLLAGCGTLFGFLQTPEGQAVGGQAAKGVGGVLTNPANPFAWYDLIAGGIGVAAGGLGLYHSPKAVRAVHRRLTKPKEAPHVAP